MDIISKYIKSAKIVLELGSRDLQDAIVLQKYFSADRVYAFECNPECVKMCNAALPGTKNITLIPKAVHVQDGPVLFRAIDPDKYSNLGASSMLKLSFENRSEEDPDRDLADVQKLVEVEGTRLDTFCRENNISTIDLIWMDLQGYELHALQSLGEQIRNVKFVYSEVAFTSTYESGTSFDALHAFLDQHGFQFVESDRFGTSFPKYTSGFVEFNVLYAKRL